MEKYSKQNKYKFNLGDKVYMVSIYNNDCCLYYGYISSINYMNNNKMIGYKVSKIGDTSGAGSGTCKENEIFIDKEDALEFIRKSFCNNQI